jgi:ATP-dependent Clp protease ATP-binding subunit ClpA
MFARFTDQAKDAMVLAQEEAARLGHPWLGTEHLLLGLLRQHDTRASRVLSSLGVTATSVERELIKEVGESRDEPFLDQHDEEALLSLGIDLAEVRRRAEESFGPGALERARPGRCGLPLMPRLKQSLERAALAAKGDFIDTDHLLLGMSRLPEALAVSLLERLGVGAAEIRASVDAHRRRAG